MLQRLRDGRMRVLVATDVAARGIDVPGISHVINFDVPRQAEDYVHRIGRTGRAGRPGVAVTLLAHRERHLMHSIERYTGDALRVGVISGLEPRPVPSAVARPGAGSRGDGAAAPTARDREWKRKSSRRTARRRDRSWGRRRGGAPAASLSYVLRQSSLNSSAGGVQAVIASRSVSASGAATTSPRCGALSSPSATARSNWPSRPSK